MKTLKIFNLAFPPGRPPRSPAYRAGVQDALLVLLDGTSEMALPYQMGSAEADAYLAGKDEGRRLAQELNSMRSSHAPAGRAQRLVQREEQIISEAQSAALQSFEVPGCAGTSPGTPAQPSPEPPPTCTTSREVKKPGVLTRIVLWAIGPALAEHDRQKREVRLLVQAELDKRRPSIEDRAKERLSQRPEWLQALDAIDARRAARKAAAEAAPIQSCPPQQAAPSQG